MLVSFQHATLPMISDNFESGDIEVNIYGLVFIIGRAYSRISYSRKI